MNTKYLRIIFLFLGAILFLLKAYAADMTWLKIGVSVLLSTIMAFFIWYFRKPTVTAINDMLPLLPESHSLMYLAGLASTILYCVLLGETSSANGFLVCSSVFLHGINLHSHKSFPEAAKACLFLSLTLQLLSVLLQTTLTTTIATLCINYAAFFLLPKHHFDQRMVEHNKTYILLTYFTISTLIVLHPYSLEHTVEEVFRIITKDCLGWGILPYSNLSFSTVLMVGWLFSLFFFSGAYLVNNRPSAVFILILLGFFLLTPWHPTTAVLFWTFTCYLPLEKKYLTIEDLTQMDVVPEDLEKEVLSNFARWVRKAEDLQPLEEYLFDHPTFAGWECYLRLSQKYMKEEDFRFYTAISKIALDEMDSEYPLEPSCETSE